MATSNRNLTDAVRQGTFREDLLYRLNVVTLRIPSLRERPADILALAEHFTLKYAELNGMPHRPLAADTRRALTANHWKGNVRELENTIHRAVLLSNGPEIGTDALVSPDGEDMAGRSDQVTRAALTAEAVTRSLVGQTVAEVEQSLILDTLDHCLGNRTHAARILGISIRTLRNKLNEYDASGVPVPDPGHARIATAA
jgi:two-component system, response regulator FlrC